VIELREGSIFDSSCQTLVNPVNCCGTMGKGLALEFRKRFPKMNEDYVHRCSDNRLKIGMPYLYCDDGMPWVLNFPTKTHWRAKSKLSDIKDGIAYLLDHYIQWHIGSLAIPALGCGLGGLDWKDTLPVIHRQLLCFAIPIELYCPGSCTVSESLRIIRSQ
jgi:O-acetyl-ADP-ribose deacetylase (regulator of RNase III)